MSIDNALNRFALGQCCGTCELAYLAPGVYCVVSSDCTGDCECSGYAVECQNYADHAPGTRFLTHCRPDCGDGVPTFPECDGGGGGNPGDDCIGECWVMYVETFPGSGNCETCLISSTCTNAPGTANPCRCLNTDELIICGPEFDIVPGQIVNVGCSPNLLHIDPDPCV